MAIELDKLREAGLIASSSNPQLTEKGRDWLRALEDVQEQESDDVAPSYADLVLSTNGLIR